jgi:type III secretion system (T3SS) SseB-like protein
VTNDRLLAAMESVKRERGPDTMRELFEALGESRLLVPVHRGDERGVEIAVMEEPEAGTTFVAFTDPKALAAYAGEDARYIDMDAPRLADVVLSEPSATLVVESGRETSGRLSRADLELLRDRLVPEGVRTAAPADAGSLRLFSLSLPVSDALAEAVARACERQPAVREAYIFEGTFGDGPRHLFLGLRFDPDAGEEEQAAARGALAEAARPALGPGEPLDVVGLLPAMLEPVAELGRRVCP